MNILLRALALACAALLPLAAAAQTYPNKPVRILVPYPPGGASDVTARILADKLSKRWSGKAAVFVENKAGANGVIGTETIANEQRPAVPPPPGDRSGFGNLSCRTAHSRSDEDSEFFFELLISRR